MCLGMKGVKEVVEKRVWGVVVGSRRRLWVGERKSSG